MIDKKDENILSVLRKNARLSMQALSKKLNMPTTTVYNRIKKLEEDGVIEQYTVKVNEQKAGKTITAYIGIVFNYDELKKNGITQHDIAKQCREKENVQLADVITGGNDMIIKVTARDVNEMDKFVTSYIQNFPGVERTNTMIVLGE
ncbi:MAG: Lrp/AsnC family transcriptional regulator [Candidatus Aenigmarchaeota archaeon]|nr:Lrp/AsnC family transcriptional regulator [Candidatus Aenigmarchaeota archaeon]